MNSCPAICKNKKQCTARGKVEYGGFCGRRENNYSTAEYNSELMENKDIIRYILDILPIKSVLSFTTTNKNYYEMRETQNMKKSISGKIRSHNLYGSLVREVWF